jgi:hypothetical protein
MRFQRLFFDRPLSQEDQCRIADNVGMSNTRVQLRDGRVIMNLGFGGVRPNGCYAGLENHVAIYADPSQTKKIFDKTFLYILDKPRHWTPRPDCNEGPAFDYRILSLGRLQLLPLPDGTFLVGEFYDNSFLLRFDNQFESKAQGDLLNTKLFVVDGVGTEGYGDRASGDLNLARLHRDLYLRLMDLKKQSK